MEALAALQETPVPTILVASGLFSLFLSIGGELQVAKIPSGKRRLLGFFGLLSFISGVILFILPIFIGEVQAEKLVATEIANEPDEIIDATITPSPILETEQLPTETARIVPASTVEPTRTSEPSPTVPLVPTNTPIPPTKTAAPTTTPSPVPEPSPIVEQESSQYSEGVRSIDGNNKIYAGPGVDEKQALGVFQYDTVAEAIGRTSWNGWVHIRLGSGLEGWVQAETVAFVTGTVDALPITWPPNSSDGAGSTSSTSPSTSNQCLTVLIELVEWPNHDFDDVYVRWTDLPAETERIYLEINGLQDGEQMPLVYPDSYDPDAEYYMGYWMFEERGFSTGTVFSYVLKAVDAEGSDICTFSGEFEQ